MPRAWSLSTPDCCSDESTFAVPVILGGRRDASRVELESTLFASDDVDEELV